MITKENPSMNSTAESIFMSNSDENIRELCRRREDAIAHENYQKKLLKEKDDKIAAQAKEIASKDNEIASQAEEIASKDNEIARLHKLLAENGIKA